MNLQSTTHNAARVYTSSKNGPVNRSFNRKAGVVITLLFFCLSLALIMIGTLRLRQWSMCAADNSVRLEKQISDELRTLKHLRNRYAALTGWSNIQKRMQDFKLNLVPAMPGQIIHIGIYTPQQASAIPLKPLSVAVRTPAQTGKNRSRR